VKVSSHPAPVVTPNKDKERGSYLKLKKKFYKTPTKGLLLTQVAKEDQAPVH
jgi:hypothetical protein